MRMSDPAAFERKVLGYIRARGLVPPGSRVIVAVSGGADSMALLAFFLACAEELHIRVEAVHVDHGLRGEASRADACHVQRFCGQNHVPLHLFDARALGTEYPERPGEDWARQLRYGYFAQLLDTAGEGTCIATAHTLNDQAETLLFRLARGTGVRGAGGIRPARDAYIRPFLCVDRQQVEGYCAAKELSYVTDQTNLEDSYARNRLRHRAVPAMTAVCPAALEAMGRFCEQMQRLDGYFMEKAETLLEDAACPGGWTLAALRAADWPVRETALLELARQVREPDQTILALLEELVQRGSGAVQLAPGQGLRARRGKLEWFHPGETGLAPAGPIPLTEGEHCLPGGYRLRVRVMEYENFIKFGTVCKKSLNYCADYDKIQGNVALRARLPGDRYRPRGRKHEKPLRKYYWELGLPPAERPLLPLAARQEQVLWLWGQGFADGLEPGPDTHKVLIIEPMIGQEEIK